MGKIVNTFAALLVIGFVYCLADYNGYFSIDQDPDMSYFSHSMPKSESRELMRNRSGVPCKQYGSLEISESLDHGRLWPDHRRQFRQDYLDKMIKQVNSFPSPEKKHARIKSLQKRIQNLEKKCFGRRN